MSGQRLGITSTIDRAIHLSRVAAEEGLEPVMLPCIDIRSAPQEVLDQARSLAERADLILVTSSRAVNSIWPDGGMPSVTAAAVGPTTSVAVEESGGSVGFVGDGGAESLLQRLQGQLDGRHVFFPHATGADMKTVETLEEMGADVSVLAVYETRPLPPGPDPVEAVVFGSPSAVLGWSLSRNFDGLVLGAIGSTTAAAIVDQGHEVDVIPRRPDFELLIAQVAKRLTDRSLL